jgi:hypothetical protein
VALLAASLAGALSFLGAGFHIILRIARGAGVTVNTARCHKHSGTGAVGLG